MTESKLKNSAPQLSGEMTPAQLAKYKQLLKAGDDAFLAKQTPEFRNKILASQAKRAKDFEAEQRQKNRSESGINKPQDGTDTVTSGDSSAQGSTEPIVSYLPGSHSGSSAPHIAQPSSTANSAPADALGGLAAAVTAQVQGCAGSRALAGSTVAAAHKPDAASALSGLDEAVSAQVQGLTRSHASAGSAPTAAHKPDTASGLSGLDEAVSAQVQRHGAYRGSGRSSASTSADAGLWVASSPLAWPGS